MYTRDEVEVLIEEYEELINLPDTTRKGLMILLRLMDIQRAVRRLPMFERRVVVLYGMGRLPAREVGQILGVSWVQVLRMYIHGLRRTIALLNGRTYRPNE